MSDRMDKETLAAFADGALEPEEAARVVMHLADCPEDQAYVDDLMALSEMLGRAYDAPMHEPVPDAIRQTVMGPAATPEAPSNVVAFRPGRQAVAGFLGGAIAAGLAAFLILSPSTSEPALFLAEGPVSDRSPAHTALTDLASGETQLLADGVELYMLASFANPAGGYCREFEVIQDQSSDAEIGLACKTPDADLWTVTVASALTVDQTAEVFVPASGADLAPITAYLDEIGAGEVLSREAEEQARQSGWTR